MASRAAPSTVALWLCSSFRKREQPPQSGARQHFRLLAAVGQELPKVTGQHVLVFLLLHSQHWASRSGPGSSTQSTVSASGFPPVVLHFDLLV